MRHKLNMSDIPLVVCGHSPHPDIGPSTLIEKIRRILSGDVVMVCSKPDRLKDAGRERRRHDDDGSSGSTDLAMSVVVLGELPLSMVVVVVL